MIKSMNATLDVQSLLDPEIAAVLGALPIDVGALLGSLSNDTITDVRATMSMMPMPELSDRVKRTDHVIDSSTGVVVRVHRPIGVDGDLPCVYWMHGGGLVLGDHAQDDARLDRWCTLFGCVGVSVGYRLAPETPYPGPLDDCYVGLRWVHDNAGVIGVDRSRIGIGGNSAGGNLAAGLALLARDRGELPVAFQLLIYPMIDDRQMTVSSQWLDPIWPPAANRYGWTAYLGAAKGGPDVPIYAAAARATELSGLPPTLISGRRDRRVLRRRHRLCGAPPSRRRSGRTASVPRCTTRIRQPRPDVAAGDPSERRHRVVASRTDWRFTSPLSVGRRRLGVSLWRRT
jgi:acetyl esterase/lipase